jgi:hypothetical protein
MPYHHFTTGHLYQGRYKAYRRFVEQGITREIENPMQRGRGHGIVGDQPFIERMSRLVADRPSPREVPALRKIRVLGSERIIALVSGQTGIPPETLLARGYKGSREGTPHGLALSPRGCEPAADR